MRASDRIAVRRCSVSCCARSHASGYRIAVRLLLLLFRATSRFARFSLVRFDDFIERRLCNSMSSACMHCSFGTSSDANENENEHDNRRATNFLPRYCRCLVERRAPNALTGALFTAILSSALVSDYDIIIFGSSLMLFRVQPRNDAPARVHDVF